MNVSQPAIELSGSLWGLKMNQYVALLRGINVGGNNLIKMPALKACFEDQGFQNVRTYIQSGNVLFFTDQSDADRLTAEIEKALTQTFKGYEARLALRSTSQMKATVSNVPEGYGSQPDIYRCDVLFLKAPLTPQEVIESIHPREGVDWAFTGPEAVYFQRLDARATQSRLSRVVSMPIYQNMTIRNWNTTTRLLRMMEEAEKG